MGRGDVNYEQVNVPDDKDRTEYSWQERRAELFRLIKKKGDPDAIPSYRSLADQYDVGKSTIGKDINKLRSYIQDRKGSQLGSRLKMFYDKAIEKAVEEENWEKAIDLSRDWYDWMYETNEATDHSGPDTEVNVDQRRETRVIFGMDNPFEDKDGFQMTPNGLKKKEVETDE